jgi:hypothetical protein
MTRTGSWSLKVVLALAVATLIWVGATSIALRSLESRIRAESPQAPAPHKLLAAR